MHILLRIKEITNENLLFSTGGKKKVQSAGQILS